MIWLPESLVLSSFRFADGPLRIIGLLELMLSMHTGILLPAFLLLAPACVAVEADTGPAADVEAIHHLVE